ncbi:MarR family transcriptional regulator [Corynebacterium phoceense]|uniref:MarR family transcriptional regulator n=1 Tax=Corynebacterium phoceense TaxID=1686286 RepID=A0A540R7X2_9CORY|nr:MarR family transcriptional regulator [Corynebacterium phoceense]TQE43840.1 MarR family transcriptional regulator [Corynebacterium phoceense]
MNEPSEPRWLDEEELDAFSSLMYVNLQLINKLDRQLRKDAGMSFYDYTVMSRLSEAPEHTMRMSALGHITGGSLSRLSQVVTRLEKNGWVRREPDPSDGRFTVAILTEAGWDTVVATAPGHVEAARRIVIDRLTRAQVRQLGQAMHRIAIGVEEEDCC